MSGVIDTELKELRNLVEKHIPSSKLEACVRAMVRVNIQRTKYKQMAVCMQFPAQYPTKPIIVEIRSKYLSQKLTDGLANLAEAEAKKLSGKPQIMKVLRYISTFLDEHPLCSCSEEISSIKKSVIHQQDEIKLKQKTSSLSLIVTEKQYRAKYNISVPEDYPDIRVTVEESSSNYPPVLRRYLLAQAAEVARRCVEPPKRTRPKDPPFQRSPSMRPVMEFLISSLHALPNLLCGQCGRTAMPEEPQALPASEDAPMAVERVYCGHLYHHACLDVYISTPPFQGGKKCHGCGVNIYHDKWKASPALVEARWAHKQARQRELDEAIEFFQ